MPEPLDTCGTLNTATTTAATTATAAAAAIAIAIALSACGDNIEGIDRSRPVTEELGDDIVSLEAGDPDWVVTEHRLLDPERNSVPLPPAERGRRLSAGFAEGDSLWVGYDFGTVYHSADRGATWVREMDGYEVGDVALRDLSLDFPVARRFMRTPAGSLLLATNGRGVMRFDEQARTWSDYTWRFDLLGNVNPIAWSAAPLGDDGVIAGSISAEGLLPTSLGDLFGLVLRIKRSASDDVLQLPLEGARLITGVAELSGDRIVAATLGAGVFRLDGNTATAIGPDPVPTDLAAMAVDDRGRIALVGFAGDVWLGDAGGDFEKVRCGSGADRGVDVKWSGGRIEVALGSRIERIDPTRPKDPLDCPGRGGARVMLAFSHHVNLYHSFRGDTNDDDGFGLDIEVIRNTIESFDAHPRLHNDWDIENLFSLDDLLPAFAPDILTDISRRITDGDDGLRLMSHNNGMMSAEAEAELAASINDAAASYEAFVPGLWSPGVQPQENMYTPAHPRAYRQNGIDWITFFYSSSSFTAFRNEIPLSLAEAHGLLTLESDVVDETMTALPVYHHADIAEHGGLANWLEQLHENLSGTAALVIHFDADSESWLGFDSELASVEALIDGGADWVIPARISDIVDQLEPVGSINIRRDMADGAFDGFASWTEKPANHRFYTRLMRSRLDAERAVALAGTPTQAIQTELDAALASRQRGFSTTHFGLANPALHPDREAAGDAVTLDAEARGRAALDLAIAGANLAADAAHNLSGAAVSFLQPIATGLDGADPGVLGVISPDGQRRWLAGTLAAGGSAALTPGDPPATSTAAAGSAWIPGVAIDVAGPRIRVGFDDEIAAVSSRAATAGAGWRVTTVEGAWAAGGAARYDWIELDADPGAVWVEVSVTYPDIDNLVEVAPIEIAAGRGEQHTITRRLATGEIASYTVSDHIDALNNHAARGWVAVGDLAVSTYAPLRSAPAFAPVRVARTEAGDLAATVAPFASLWGEMLDHDAPRLLGTGVGELITRLLSPQLRPTAPAWRGQSATFLLRIELAPGDLGRRDGARDGVVILDAGGAVVDPGRG